jgi:NAD(P)-dependent dehydrogenase (short-subunit alcohol dehydrogenase family)
MILLNWTKPRGIASWTPTSKGNSFVPVEAAKLMKNQGGGAIVNIASTRALMSEPNSEAYAASKGGIVALTHALAASLAPHRIVVNAVLPGWIETGDYDQLSAIATMPSIFRGAWATPTILPALAGFCAKPTEQFHQWHAVGC